MSFNKNEQLVAGTFIKLHKESKVWPTQNKVAKVMGVSRGTVCSAIGRLKQKGVIVTNDRHMVVSVKNICQMDEPEEKQESNINWLSVAFV